MTSRVLKWLGIVHILVAVNIILFWIEFYSGIIFPMDVMSEKITNFDGYYAWETAFTIPDGILALVMIIGGARLVRDTGDRLGKTLLTAASGACIFLGVLDFTYDLGNGMFTLGHIFSWMLLTIGIFLPLFGIASIYVLHKTSFQVTS